MHRFDVVDAIASNRVRQRFAIVELVSAIKRAVGSNYFQIQIVDQCDGSARKSRRIGINERNLERVLRTRNQNLMLEHLAVRQLNRLVGKVEYERRIKKCG